MRRAPCRCGDPDASPPCGACESNVCIDCGEEPDGDEPCACDRAELAPPFWPPEERYTTWRHGIHEASWCVDQHFYALLGALGPRPRVVLKPRSVGFSSDAANFIRITWP